MSNNRVEHSKYEKVVYACTDCHSYTTCYDSTRTDCPSCNLSGTLAVVSHEEYTENIEVRDLLLGQGGQDQ